ncbi:hypothetical protein PSEUDO9AG_41296 [Pseudomonas sp. 9Ag]|nr:hypothetical protein PSEUDO9AG_41296 [Pseudomonas sp. 9Ag]
MVSVDRCYSWNGFAQHFKHYSADLSPARLLADNTPFSLSQCCTQRIAQCGRCSLH